MAFELGGNPSQTDCQEPYPFGTQSFAVADLLRPHRDGMLVWNELFGIISHPITQKALSCLLEKGEFDDISSRSTILDEMLSRSVEFVGR